MPAWSSQKTDDLDAIRFRAGLQLIKNTNPGISQTELLTAIQKERQVELFTEWGHRWLDLKRTGQLSKLYPIPKEEIDRNPNMTQNQGY